MEDPKIIDALNRKTAQEHACAIRYATSRGVPLLAQGSLRIELSCEDCQA